MQRQQRRICKENEHPVILFSSFSVSKRMLQSHLFVHVPPCLIPLCSDFGVGGELLDHGLNL